MEGLGVRIAHAVFRRHPPNRPSVQNCPLRITHPEFRRLDPPMVAIRHERPSDVSAREVLLDRAFGEARFAKTCERLRVGRLPAAGLSLVATDDGRVVGTVRLWHILTGFD